MQLSFVFCLQNPFGYLGIQKDFLHGLSMLAYIMLDCLIIICAIAFPLLLISCLLEWILCIEDKAQKEKDRNS